MVERLTDKHTVSVYNNSNSEIYLGGNEEATKYIYKLAQLEDIMEKYGIESLDTLEHIIKKGQVINSTIEGFAKEAYNEMQTDRDTWKRACEFLAYEYAEEYFDGRDIEHCFNADKRDKFVKENINRFYQQAKNMEGNDE